MRGLFVTGTDTNVGKTRIASMLCAGIRELGVAVGVYKPACSGAFVRPNGDFGWADLDELRAGAQITEAIADEVICPQRFREPIAPHLSAAREGRKVNPKLLRSGIEFWRQSFEVVIVEGAGGWFSPLSDADRNSDVAVDLGEPVLLVARAGLGTINHTLLSVEAIRTSGLPLLGVVLNDVSGPTDAVSIQENAAEIGKYGNVPVLGMVSYGERTATRMNGSAISPKDWANMLFPGCWPTC